MQRTSGRSPEGTCHVRRLTRTGAVLVSVVLGQAPPSGGLSPGGADGGFEEITEEMKLETVVGIGARLGTVVALSGDIAVAGARTDAGPQGNPGAAHVFERDPDGPEPWRVAKKLLSSDGEDGDRFGEYLAMDGETLVVTAWPENQAYIFERHAGGPNQWGEVKILVGHDIIPGEQFGSAAAVHGDTIAIGAQAESGPLSRSGAVYVFERNEGGPNNWGQTAKLKASDAGSDHCFGSSVDIDGDRLAVGSGAAAGERAYVFERSGPGLGDWQEMAVLFASGSGAAFGKAVTISGETVAVGAPDENVEPGDIPGAAYVFEKDHGGPDAWGEIKRLEIPERDGPSEEFGLDLVLRGDRLVVGAPGAGNEPDAGAVWVHDRNEGGPNNWGPMAKLLATDPANADGLGQAIGFDGNTVVAGASGVNAEASDEGAAYTFLLGPTLWASGICPGPMVFGLAGGTPGEQVGLVWSTDRGSFVVEQGSCVGLELGLDEPQPANVLPADADGEVYFPFASPLQACGLEIQAIDLTSCEPSNVETVPGG